MRGVRKSIKLAAAVMVTITMLADYQIVEGESQNKGIEFEPIPESAAEEQPEEWSPFYRTHDVQIFSAEETELLKKIATAEAGNQGEDGMWMVMSVVINRRGRDPWPATLKEVVLEPQQFTSVSNGSINKVTEYSEACERALERILIGDVAPEIIAFETKESNELDEYFWPAFTYKGHKFYTKK